MIAGIKDKRHEPSDAMHNPPQPFEFLSKETYLIRHKDTHVIYWHLTPRLLILKRCDDGNPSKVNIKQLCGLDGGVAASFQRSQIHKPHAHSQAFKVNNSNDF
ncbi:hypothetical protein Tco_0741955 [Tanacetum coccineum]